MQLSDLHMGGARFAVAFTRRPSADGVPARLAPDLVVGGTDGTESAPETVAYAFDASGVDRVEFLVTLNPGEPLRPLARVASGGETSRLMLALKTVLGDADQVPVLVFDEIEAGLGGRSGGIVGDKLARLAEHHQVICISHLPQIAARADRHLNVSKSVAGGRTRVAIGELRGEERVNELAAMLGGISEATLQSARELLDGGRQGEERLRRANRKST
jgi:DNA repair protein RecN (Recombination protein N)